MKLIKLFTIFLVLNTVADLKSAAPACDPSIPASWQINKTCPDHPGETISSLVRTDKQPGHTHYGDPAVYYKKNLR
jgi:hypothetical protein